MSTFVLPMASDAPPMFGKKLHPPNLNSEVLLGGCGIAVSWAVPPLLLPSSLLPPMAGNTRVLPEASNLPPMVGKKLTPSSNPKLDEVFGDCGRGPAVRRPRFWAFPPLPSRPSTCFRLPPIMSGKTLVSEGFCGTVAPNAHVEFSWWQWQAYRRQYQL